MFLLRHTNNFILHATCFLICTLTLVEVSVADKLYSLSGRTFVLRENKPSSTEGVMISLTPKRSETLQGTEVRESKQWVITNSDKRFVPSTLVIRKGDSVAFLNSDKVKHNVFSLSETNPFDLGTYGHKKSPAVNFLQPGIVKVYCNIHAEMAAFIMVSDSNWNSVSGKDGEYNINNITPGEYSLWAWSIRGEVKRDIRIGPDSPTTLAIKIPENTDSSTQHLNKFGRSYPPRIDEEDEFY